MPCRNHSHSSIRHPCPNCKHTPAVRKRNPSAKNHHGRCSFKRYHKKYCARHKCGCQPLKRARR